MKKICRWLPPLLVLTGGLLWFGNCTVGSTRIRVKSAALPAAFSGLRISVIADLHGRMFGKGHEMLLKTVEKQAPDLIALCGDLADEDTKIDSLKPLLEGLTAIAPVFYVTGNHEWVMTHSQRQVLFELLEQTGVTRLENSWQLVAKDGASIVLAGVDDPNGPADQKKPDRLMEQIRACCGDGAYVLMLSHRNDQLDLWAELGADLVLCGHAHGGIVRLPFVGGVFGTHYEFFPEYTAGLYEKGETDMILSRGLGGSRRLPLRIGNRPEVVLAELERE